MALHMNDLLKDHGLHRRPNGDREAVVITSSIAVVVEASYLCKQQGLSL